MLVKGKIAKIVNKPFFFFFLLLVSDTKHFVGKGDIFVVIVQLQLQTQLGIV